MSKLLHSSKRTIVLLIIQFLILIAGITLGIIGRIIHNDLMKESMNIMPILVYLIMIGVLLSEKDNIKFRKNGEKIQQSALLGFMIVLSVLLISIWFLVLFTF